MIFAAAGSMTTIERCFPESLQVPALGSADLRALQDRLARRIADAQSSGAAEHNAPQPVSATLTRTANRAATHASSGSARVDLFFKYKGSDSLADTQASHIEQLLHQVHTLQLPPCYCVSLYGICSALLLQKAILPAVSRLGKRMPQTH